MRFYDTYPLRVLEKVADQVQRRPELADLLRHQVEGDDGEIFVLPGQFAAKSDTSTRWSIPSMINHEANNEEGSRVDGEVGH